MQGVKRKLVYVSLYELIGMTFSALGLALLSGTHPSSTGPLAVVITTIAVTWNFIYTSVFERWESRQADRTRTVKRVAGNEQDQHQVQHKRLHQADLHPPN